MVTQKSAFGEIIITSDVITTLAGAAATSCFGVKGMAKRSMSDGIVHLLKREAMGKGVFVTYHDDGSISIELHIIVDYGVNILAITTSIIDQVRYQIESTTGLIVSSVDVFVDSMFGDK